MINADQAFSLSNNVNRSLSVVENAIKNSASQGATSTTVFVEDRHRHEINKKLQELGYTTYNHNNSSSLSISWNK